MPAGAAPGDAAPEGAAWGGGGGGEPLCAAVPAERDWARCMICAMLSGLDSSALRVSSNSATPFPCLSRAVSYFWIALLLRSTSAAPPGLFMTWFIIFTISVGLPRAAAWAAR